MFEFSPPEAEQQIDLVNNRVIVCYGSTIELRFLMDWFATKKCGIHTVSQALDHESMSSMSQRVRCRLQSNTVLLITDQKDGLPAYVTRLADMVLFAASAGSIVVEKDASHRTGRVFVCRGTSSPTGRSFVPSSPAMHSIRPDPRDKKLVDAIMRGQRSAPSMGAVVDAIECPMCDAGIPLKKSHVKFTHHSIDPIPGGEHFQHPTDIQFQVHPGPAPVARLTWTDKGALTLNDSKGREFIRVNAEGEAFVRGEKVAAGQQDIYEMFRAWVRSQFVMAEVRFPEAGKVAEPDLRIDGDASRNMLSTAVENLQRAADNTLQVGGAVVRPAPPSEAPTEMFYRCLICNDYKGRPPAPSSRLGHTSYNCAACGGEVLVRRP